MIRAVRLMLAAAAIGAVLVSGAPDPIERGILRLHYVQKPIGYEKYEVVREGDVLTVSSDFDFTDRGGRVQLAATLRMQPDFTPLSFRATGKSYRFVNVDSDVRIDGGDAIVKADGAESRVPLSAPFYTVDGYAPFAAQMMMLRYWKQHGQPDAPCRACRPTRCSSSRAGARRSGSEPPRSASSAIRSTVSSGDARPCGSTTRAGSPPRSRAPEG